MDSAALSPAPTPTNASAAEELVPPVVPDHELLRCIGRGSYGEVWLACNVMGEYRAVKIVYRATFEDERPFEREFEGIRRFEPISRSHPSQLHILHVGRSEGCFYYVMELADDANPLPSVAAGVRRLPSPGPRVSRPAAASDDQSDSRNLDRSSLDEHAAAGDSRAPQSEPPHVGCYEPKTLRSELKRQGPLPIDRCQEIGLALAGALAHLHARLCRARRLSAVAD